MLFLLFSIPVVSTFAGGLLALRFRKSLALLIALGAGLLLGASFLDLLPEALAIPSNVSAANILAVSLLSFLAFFAIQSGLNTFYPDWTGSTASHPALGRAGAVMLILHSVRDGMAIGLSYAISHQAGYAVAVGIAAHDIGDGINTIVLITRNEQAKLSDYIFLAADSLAPLAGGLLTVWWTFSQRNSALLLAAASGFFLQIATSDFLPQARRSNTPQWKLLLFVLLGTAVIYAANLIAGTLR